MAKLSVRNLAITVGMSTLLVMALIACSGFTAAGGNNSNQTGPAALLKAGAASNGDGTSYTISVNGSGLASAQPDVMDIQLGVETIDPDAGQAISQNTSKMNAVMSALKELGVAEKDIQTANYSMWIEQIYDQNGQPTGEQRYHVTNLVNVRLRDLAKAGELLQKVTTAGANNISGITFSVADPSALQREARDKAVADAKAKAEQLATALGVKVGNVHQVSEYTSTATPEYLRTVLMDAKGGGDVSVSGGSYNVVIDVSVVFDIVQ